MNYSPISKQEVVERNPESESENEEGDRKDEKFLYIESESFSSGDLR
jgi:hypothetical protein